MSYKLPFTGKRRGRARRGSLRKNGICPHEMPILPKKTLREVPPDLPVHEDCDFIRVWREKDILLLTISSPRDQKNVSIKSHRYLLTVLFEIANRENYSSVAIHHGRKRRLGWRDYLRKEFGSDCQSFQGYKGVSIVYFRKKYIRQPA